MEAGSPGPQEARPRSIQSRRSLWVKREHGVGGGAGGEDVPGGKAGAAGSARTCARLWMN